MCPVDRLRYFAAPRLLLFTEMNFSWFPTRACKWVAWDFSPPFSSRLDREKGLTVLQNWKSTGFWLGACWPWSRTPSFHDCLLYPVPLLGIRSCSFHVETSLFEEPKFRFAPKWWWSHVTLGLSLTWRPAGGSPESWPVQLEPPFPLFLQPYRLRFAMQNRLSQVGFWLATLFNEFTKCSTNTDYSEGIGTVE